MMHIRNKWLASANRDDLTNFRQARSRARLAIRTAKNTWFQQHAELVEKEKLGGKIVWKCIRDMQRGRRGHVPCRFVINMVIHV